MIFKYSARLPRWVFLLPVIPLGLFLSDISGSQNQQWFLSINQQTARIPDIVWTTLSMFGNGWAVFAVALPLLLFARKALYAALIAGIFAAIFSNVAKPLFKTSRPAGVIDQQLMHIIEHPLLHSAMPSGHTMTAFSIATAIYFSLDVQKKWPWLCLFLLAAASSLSRIAVGAHWPEDVLVGSAFGIVAGLIGAQLAKFIPASALDITAWPVKVILLASLVNLYILIMDTIDFKLNHNTQFILAGIIVITWIKVIPRIIDREQ